MKFLIWSRAILAAAESNYDLTVIEDGQTPLAPGPAQTVATPYFAWTVAIMCVMVVACGIALYMNACRKYRQRYVEITKRANMSDRFAKPGWNLRKLKLQVNEAEGQIAERMLGNV